MGGRGANIGAKAMALPKLTGSEKQIAWAEDIRKAALDNLNDLYEKEKELISGEKLIAQGKELELQNKHGEAINLRRQGERLNNAEEMVGKISVTDRQKVFSAVMQELREITSAKTFIDGYQGMSKWKRSNFGELREGTKKAIVSRTNLSMEKVNDIVDFFLYSSR